MNEIYGIQFMFQIRERYSSKVFLDTVVCLKFPKGKRFIVGFDPSGKDDESQLCSNVKRAISNYLHTFNIHLKQKIGIKLIQSLEGRNWFCDACVLEVTHFEKVTQLQSWYEQNSKSSFDQFLNTDVLK